jgi:hypothetical protein
MIAMARSSAGAFQSILSEWKKKDAVDRQLQKRRPKAPFSWPSAAIRHARNAACCASDDGDVHAAILHGDASHDDGGDSHDGDDASGDGDDHAPRHK